MRRATHHPTVWPAALAAALALVWLAAAPATPDLAAQVYRSGLFAREGFAVWDNAWYGGHHLPGYSLVFPPLAALLGTRLVGVLAAIAATVLFDRLARAHFGARAHWGSVWFASAAVCDLLIGRVTYALGVAVGLGALMALQHGRPKLAGAIGVVCAACSPVAALFLALAGAAVALERLDRDSPRRDRSAWLATARTTRAWRAPLPMALGALALVLALAVAFPEGGRQPFGTRALLALLALTAGVALLLPRRERALRLGAGLYLLVGLAAFVLPTPMGSNATRLGAAFAGPLLVCAVRGTAWQRTAVLGLAALCVAYQWYAPVREVAKVAQDPSTQAAYYAPLLGFLEGRAHGGRVEVPFTRGHWEAVHLARHVPLARGWETQLDTKYNKLFYERRPVVGVNEYRAWLRRTSVRWVAVPDVPLDPSGRREANLIAMGVPYLQPAWRSRHWTVFRFTDPLPLVQGGARLLSFDSQRAVLRFPRAGAATLRVRWSSYFRPRGAAACVSRTAHGWTRVRALEAGRVRVRASFSPRRIAGRAARCGGGARLPD